MKKLLIILYLFTALFGLRVTLSDNDGDVTTIDNNALNISSMLLNVPLGRVDGVSAINKFGFNGDIDTSGLPQTVWDFGGLYTFSDTANISQLSSSSASDIGNITVIGLDSNYNEVIQIAKLNGQTNVYLATNLIRSYRMYNSGSNDFVGSVYLSVSNTAQSSGVPSVNTNVRAHIDIGNNQTLMCVYTVPAGKTAVFTSGYVAFANNKSSYAILTWRARPYGGVFQVKSIISLVGLGSSVWTYRYGVPVALPEKTDIVIQCDEVSANNTAISGGFDLVLYDN